MRAIQYTATGPATDVLRQVRIPRPSPQTGEVLVRIHASGINPADVKRRAGWNGMVMAHRAVIPHCDGAGIIDAVGSGVDQDRVGQRVWLWNAQGGYGEAGRADGTAAEFIAIPSEQAVDLPDELSFEEGACLGVPALTAFLAVLGDGPVSGKRVLVQGGAGAVGLAAVQIAAAAGAQVLATVGSADSARALKDVRGITVLDRHTPDLSKQVQAATDGKGVDRIIEVDLAANMATDLQSLAPHGVIASYSSSSDPNPILPYYDFANLGASIRFVQGFRLPDPLRREAENTINDLIRAGHLRPRIGVCFDFNDIASAHDRVAAGAQGQTVLSLSSLERTK